MSAVDKFQNLKCLYTEQDIFGGILPNGFAEIASESGSECEESVVTFSENITCFTHLKLNFYLYCTNCQKEFKDKFEPLLYTFSRAKNDDS